MGFYNNTNPVIVIPHDYLIEPKSVMTYQQKLDDISLYKENESCNIIFPTSTITQQLKDEINYCLASVNFYHLDSNNRLNCYPLLTQRLKFNSLEEIILYLKDKSKKFYLSKVVEHIGICYYVYLYQVDNKATQRDQLINQLLEDEN